MTKRIKKNVEIPQPVPAPKPESLGERLDVTLGAGGTVGGLSLKTPTADVPQAFSGNPLFAKDIRASNPVTIPLSPAAIHFYADAKNLLRLGEGFVDARVQAGYRPGTHARAWSVEVGGDYRYPMAMTRFGALTVFGGVRAGIQRVSGELFGNRDGREMGFAGFAGQVAVAAGLEFLAGDRCPVRLSIALQRTSGDFGGGVGMEGTAFLATLEAGCTVVENGKMAWNVPSIEAGLPPPRTP